MSVINKMLRDLDSRRASSAVPPQGAKAGVTRGTASVKGVDLAHAKSGEQLWRVMPLTVFLVLGVAAAGWWYWNGMGHVVSSAQPQQMVVPAAMPSIPVTATATAPLPVITAATLPPAMSQSALSPVASGSASLPTGSEPALLPPVGKSALAPPVGEQKLHQMLDEAGKAVPARQAAAPALPPEVVQQVKKQLALTPEAGKITVPVMPPGLADELQQQLARPATKAAPVTAPVPVRPAPSQPSQAFAGASTGTARADGVGNVSPQQFSKFDAAVKAAPKPEGAVKAQAPVEPVATNRGLAAASMPAAALKPPAAAKSHAAAKQPEPALAQRAVDPRQAAALETMAQAQQLWNSGSREAALELMRKAVAVAERSNASGAEPGGSPAFMGLVRELARMELAEGQVNQVWDLMVRLEPVISDQADLWAVRGNAAQRLGRHQDSVNAYLTALKLRPSEPRWMLGAAVSLAVQGQTGAAAELADKARAAGVVNSEVLAYLRQLGVPLRDR